MCDLPFVVPFEQSKNIGSAGIGPGQVAGPTFYLQMNDGDTLDDFNACEARARVLHSLTVARNGCGGMERWSHELSVTCTRTRDVGMHRASNRVVLDEVRVSNRIRNEEIAGLVGRKGGGAL